MIRKPCKRVRLPATTNQQKYSKNPAQQNQKNVVYLQNGFTSKLQTKNHQETT